MPDLTAMQYFEKWIEDNKRALDIGLAKLTHDAFEEGRKYQLKFMESQAPTSESPSELITWKGGLLAHPRVIEVLKGYKGRAYKAERELIELRKQPPTDPGWISVKDRMPEHGRKVIATYRNSLDKKRTIIGCFIERWKEECGCDSEDNYEYSEEKDEYFLCEGWYEQQDNWNDYASIFVHEGTVTHWMPEPQGPIKEPT